MYTNHSSPDGLAFDLRSFFGIELNYPVSVRQAAPPVVLLLESQTSRKPRASE